MSETSEAPVPVAPYVNSTDLTAENAVRTQDADRPTSAIPAVRIKSISSNYIRAQQAESEGNDREELRYLLFVAQEISELLEARVNNRMESSMATSYAESLCHCAARIRELIREEDVMQHLLTSADQILNRANDDAKRKNRQHS